MSWRLEMLAESGSVLPHAWVAGDDEMGRAGWFPPGPTGPAASNTCGGALEYADPRPGGRRASIPGEGRHPENPAARWTSGPIGSAEGAWTRIEVRDGMKGPLVVEAVKRRAAGRTRDGWEGSRGPLLLHHTGTSIGSHTYKFGLLPVVRAATNCWRTGAGRRKRSIASRNARSGPRGGGPGRLPGEELAGVVSPPDPGGCWPRGSCTEETRRGKIRTPAATSPQLRQLIAGLIGAWLDVNELSKQCRRSTRWLRRNEQARFYYHRSRNIMPRLKNELRL